MRNARGQPSAPAFVDLYDPVVLSCPTSQNIKCQNLKLMTDDSLINIFDINKINELIACPNFATFLSQQNAINFTLALSEFPWELYQIQLSLKIIGALVNLNPDNDCNNVVIPREGLKGIYFCIPLHPISLTIHGSLYYNETDWAANADFNPDIDVYEILDEIQKKILNKNHEEILARDIAGCFLLFTIYQTINRPLFIAEIANAGVTVGSNTGHEIQLGAFSNGVFQSDIKFIEYGEYEASSTAPEYVDTSKPIYRGEMWDYLYRFYKDELSGLGLTERFNEGEVEALKIADEFNDFIFINRCTVCNNIKKTPRARLCLKCGDFRELL